ncbi:hypothetical protein DPMN_049375 [Dreissena polymorpha]|uniref:Uncharacterized protein n=1 Tax=Dreissena polymorpha TaxID=45954 RepID=A0A9D4CF80_DREPO|nr:hypothetical protein DPMN_049375 [Dreissena polymorpha]
MCIIFQTCQRASFGLSCSRIKHRSDSVGLSSTNVVPTSPLSGNLVQPPTWSFRRTSAPRWAPFVVGVVVGLYSHDGQDQVGIKQRLWTCVH